MYKQMLYNNSSNAHVMRLGHARWNANFSPEAASVKKICFPEAASGNYTCFPEAASRQKRPHFVPEAASGNSICD